MSVKNGNEVSHGAYITCMFEFVPVSTPESASLNASMYASIYATVSISI